MAPSDVLNGRRNRLFFRALWLVLVLLTAGRLSAAEFDAAVVPNGLDGGSWQRILGQLDAEVADAEADKGLVHPEVIKLLGAEASDNFGFSVAVSGDIVVVGAILGDGVAEDSGAAYIFERNHGGPDNWGQVTTLAPTSGGSGDNFGFAVAIDDDTVVVGAPNYDGFAVDAGAAFVFGRNQGGADNWGQVDRIGDTSASQGDYFGFSVAVQVPLIVVGAAFGNIGVPRSGAAYVFERNQGTQADTWGQVGQLVVLSPSEDDHLGFRIAIECDTVVVGSYNAQAAYVFERNHGGAGAWGKLVELTGGYSFGRAVAIAEETIAVGAPGDEGGLVVIFERNQGGDDNWGQVTEVTPVDLEAEDTFGEALWLRGDRLVVATRRDDDWGDDTGSVSLFERNAGGADTWGQVGKITASDPDLDTFFGQSIHLSGSTLVVGTPYDDDQGYRSGSVTIYSTLPDLRSDVMTLTNPNPGNGNHFGNSVGLSGDTAVVGAPMDDVECSDCGAAYVFSRNQGGVDAWSQIGTLTPSVTVEAGNFGEAVGISCDTAVVGVPLADVSGADAGVATVFVRNESSADDWDEVQVLTGPDVVAGDHFGESVAISCDRLAVGATDHQVGGDTVGAVYLFERNQGSADAWGWIATLTADPGQDGSDFGCSVAMEGDVVLVGACAATVVSAGAGAAYVFERNFGGMDSWDQRTKISLTSGQPGAAFGSSVSIDGSTAVIGAPGVTGGQGAVFVVERNQGGANGWGQVVQLSASDPESDGGFGTSVAISGNLVVVGGPRSNVSGYDEGEVYVFERNDGGVADGWDEVFKISSGSPANEDHWGSAVALDGHTLIMGAPDADPGSDGSGSAAAVRLLGAEADLEVTLLDSGDPLWSGESSSYTVSVTNQGPAVAQGAVFTIVLPAAVSVDSIVPGEPTCTDVGGAVSCRAADLNPGSMDTVTVYFTVDQAFFGEMTASAHAAAIQPDLDFADNRIVETTLVKAAIFTDDFETGDTGEWSSVSP